MSSGQKIIDGLKDVADGNIAKCHVFSQSDKDSDLDARFSRLMGELSNCWSEINRLRSEAIRKQREANEVWAQIKARSTSIGKAGQ